MNAALDRQVDEMVSEFTQALADLSRRIPPDAEPTSADLQSELIYQINRSLAGCAELERELADEPALLKQAQTRYRAAIAPWFEKSWFMRRALHKPRGYPGDYELLTAIYNGAVKSPGIGGYLDKYFLGTTLAGAVIARMLSLRQFLVEELNRRGSADVSVLNVACGACREYVADFHPTNHRQIRVTCVDNDEEALLFVAANVGPAIRRHAELNLVRYNALRMTSARQNVRRFGRPDIIYSVGLCDYIPDEYLVPLLAGWRESVAPGGVVYVAFKDSEKYTTEEYQWLVDWYFFQRTRTEHRQLFERAGYDMSQVGETLDATGVIVNFIARNAPSGVVRLDGPQALLREPTAGTAADSVPGQ
jgi:hypothetical protein